MAISNDDLRYEFVLQSTFGGLLSGDTERDAWVHLRAQEMHALLVVDAVRDVAMDAALHATARDHDAIIHLRYGVAHRAKFMWGALRRMLALAPAQREEPLPLDDVEVLASDLNVIYLNIRGALDNYAWCLKALRPSPAMTALQPQQVDLFGRRFRDALNWPDLDAAIAPFEGWYGDLRSRRDPAAHRIPLTVPPAILDEAAQAEYAAIDQQHAEALAKAIEIAGRESGRPDEPFDMEKAEQIEAAFEVVHLIHIKRQTVGRFPGVFMHHPAEPTVPIYPTVAEDIGSFVAVARGATAVVQQLASIAAG